MGRITSFTYPSQPGTITPNAKKSSNAKVPTWRCSKCNLKREWTWQWLLVLPIFGFMFFFYSVFDGRRPSKTDPAICTWCECKENYRIACEKAKAEENEKLWEAHISKEIPMLASRYLVAALATGKSVTVEEAIKEAKKIATDIANFQRGR